MADELDDLIERFTADDPELPAMVAALTEAHQLVRDLAVLRERRGLTQAEVARRIGTTQSAIARLERAEVDPRLSTVVKYLTVLGAALTVDDGSPARLTAAT